MEDSINNDGKTEYAAILDFNAKDGELLRDLKKSVEDSDKYWNSELGLKEIRKANWNLWLPKHHDGEQVYEHEKSNIYEDNRIFTSVETLVSTLNARIPQPEVLPGQESPTSIQLAKDVQKTLYAYFEKYGIDDKFRICTRNFVVKRGGPLLKLRWDESKGMNGEIVTEILDPDDVIVDQDAKYGETPRFIAHKIRDLSGEDLCSRFPDSKQEIYELLGVERRNSKGERVAQYTQLKKKKDIYEVWFSYYDKKEKGYISCVAWMDCRFQVMLDKQKNPNWNYEDSVNDLPGGIDDETYRRNGNILDEPMPPFIPFNFLNDGTSYIDQTSLVEQAATLQRTLNKRGFQIMQNADMAESGIVFDTNKLEKEDAANLIGSPKEKIGVSGDIRAAIDRLPVNMLPSYVIEDKFDIRNEIDNVFATHNVTRGEQSDNKTLGQDRMQLGQDASRADELARSIERAAALYYRYLVQMMKVYYDEPHYYKAVGEDGQFDHVMMKSDLIEDGIDIKVEAGSTLPLDKAGQNKWVSDLVSAGLIDPLTVFEVAAGGNMPSPKKMFERYMTFKSDPVSMLQMVSDDDVNRQALLDIQILNTGNMPKPRDEYQPAYFEYMNKYMTSGDFLKQPDQIRAQYIKYLEIAQAQAMRQMQALETQLPAKEEVEASNQQTLQDAQMEQQIGAAAQGGMMPPGPQEPAQPATPQSNPQAMADQASQSPAV